MTRFIYCAMAFAMACSFTSTVQAESISLYSSQNWYVDVVIDDESSDMICLLTSVNEAKEGISFAATSSSTMVMAIVLPGWEPVEEPFTDTIFLHFDDEQWELSKTLFTTMNGNSAMSFKFPEDNDKKQEFLGDLLNKNNLSLMSGDQKRIMTQWSLRDVNRAIMEFRKCSILIGHDDV